MPGSTLKPLQSSILQLTTTFVYLVRKCSWSKKYFSWCHAELDGCEVEQCRVVLEARSLRTFSKFVVRTLFIAFHFLESLKTGRRKAQQLCYNWECAITHEETLTLSFHSGAHKKNVSTFASIDGSELQNWCLMVLGWVFKCGAEPLLSLTLLPTDDRSHLTWSSSRFWPSLRWSMGKQFKAAH